MASQFTMAESGRDFRRSVVKTVNANPEILISLLNEVVPKWVIPETPGIQKWQSKEAIEELQRTMAKLACSIPFYKQKELSQEFLTLWREWSQIRIARDRYLTDDMDDLLFTPYNIRALEKRAGAQWEGGFLKIEEEVHQAAGIMALVVFVQNGCLAVKQNRHGRPTRYQRFFRIMAQLPDKVITRITVYTQCKKEKEWTPPDPSAYFAGRHRAKPEDWTIRPAPCDIDETIAHGCAYRRGVLECAIAEAIEAIEFGVPMGF
jgi:hypothetical protein